MSIKCWPRSLATIVVATHDNHGCDDSNVDDNGWGDVVAMIMMLLIVIIAIMAKYMYIMMMIKIVVMVMMQQWC